jgi:hypothetical protein
MTKWGSTVATSRDVATEYWDSLGRRWVALEERPAGRLRRAHPASGVQDDRSPKSTGSFNNGR